MNDLSYCRVGLSAMPHVQLLPDGALLRIQGFPSGGASCEEPSFSKNTLEKMLVGVTGNRIAYNCKTGEWIFLGFQGFPQADDSIYL